ncbi:hypothetical protein [Parapedobacter tibetensis]|uniref:hypothetical protein n=1 Tax=Parapedobacter tibetensis TaxID=2972951 RepID=UPI00214D3C11|nr:hypothetical protein [Parapedobacter tibetensis]
MSVVDFTVVHPGPSTPSFLRAIVEVFQVGILSHPFHKLEAGPAYRIDAQQLQTALGACGLPRLELSEPECVLARFGDEAGVKGDQVMSTAVLLDQSAVEFEEIERLFELSSLALCTILPYRSNCWKLLPACVDILYV